MLASIKQFFNSHLHQDQGQDNGHRLQLAAAALLIELSRADYQQDPEEQQAIEAALQKAFTLDDEYLQDLVRLAETENAQATSLYPFTSLINEQYTDQQRFDLVKMLWQVAIADGEISKYEDHLIRKIAELIYLPHSEFIRAKLAVLNNERG